MTIFENVRSVFFTLPTNLSVALWNAYLDYLEDEVNVSDTSDLRIHVNGNEFFEEEFSEICRVIEVVQGSPNYNYNDDYVVLTSCKELISFKDPCVFIQNAVEKGDSLFWQWLYNRIVESLDKSFKEA